MRAVVVCNRRVHPEPRTVKMEADSTKIMKISSVGDDDDDGATHIKSFSTAKPSILKNTPSPDVKKKHGPALAWQDFHGKPLAYVMEYDVRYEGDQQPNFCCCGGLWLGSS